MSHDRRRRRRSCFEITREEQRRRRLIRQRAELDAVSIVQKTEAFASVLLEVLAWSLMPGFLKRSLSYPLTPFPAPWGPPVSISALPAPAQERAAMTADELAWSNAYAGMRAIWSGSAATSLLDMRWRELRELVPDVVSEIGQVAVSTKQTREGYLRELKAARNAQNAEAAARAVVARLRREKAARVAQDAHMAPPGPQITPEVAAAPPVPPKPGLGSDDDDEPSEYGM
jgi:hypothetical protein